MRARPIAAALAGTALLAGCAVGPDFVPPAPPESSGYLGPGAPSATASADTQGGAAQHFAPARDIPGEWWTLFQSPALNRLIDEALKANPNIAAAQAALSQAQELQYAGEGALWPQVKAGLGTTREKFSLATVGQKGSTIFTVNTAAVSVSYAIDLWGASRRGIEALEAQTDYQRFQLEAAYLSLSANVVTAAVLQASLKGQIAATQQIVTIESEELDRLKREFALGAIANTAVLAQAAALAQTRAGLPPLQRALGQARDLMAALLGRLPDAAPEADIDLAALQLPQELPLSVPSKLVEQRPDIRSAEEQLHAASANIGVAIANMLPQISLSAALGSTTTGALFQPGTGVWSIAGALTQPLFEGGTLLHKKRAAVAAFTAAAAQYQSTVVTAFQGVADVLRALEADADTQAATLAAERAAGDSLAVARRQFEIGAGNYLSLLTAEQTYQQSHIALVQAEAARYADTAALFQALGGGWWNRKDVAAAK